MNGCGARLRRLGSAAAGVPERGKDLERVAGRAEDRPGFEQHVARMILHREVAFTKGGGDAAVAVQSRGLVQATIDNGVGRGLRGQALKGRGTRTATKDQPRAFGLERLSQRTQ